MNLPYFTGIESARRPTFSDRAIPLAERAGPGMNGHTRRIWSAFAAVYPPLMRRVAVIPFLCLAGTILSARAPASRAPAIPPPLALIHATVVDVKAGTTIRDQTIVLRNGRIESVSGAAPPSGVRAVDLEGRFALPGLVDAH